MLLIGLQDELIAQLNDLNAACLLTTQDYVAVLTHLDSRHYILELEYLLDGFQRIHLFIMRWSTDSVDFHPGRDSCGKYIRFLPLAEGQIGSQHARGLT
jgi:hypothetical protein